MLERIKSLAVTKLHAVIHIVNLHDAKQQTDETVRAFTARVCVIAASCILIKAFSGQDCRAIGYTVLSNLSPSTSRDNSIMANHANQGPGSLTHPPPKWGSITPPCTVPLFGFAIDRAPNPEQPTRALQRPAPGPKYNFALPLRQGTTTTLPTSQVSLMQMGATRGSSMPPPLYNDQLFFTNRPPSKPSTRTEEVKIRHQSLSPKIIGTISRPNPVATLAIASQTSPKGMQPYS